VPTALARLAELCRELEHTSSRNRKNELLAEFLKGLEPDEIRPAVLILLARLLPESESKTLNVGYSLLKRAWETGQTKLFAEGDLTITEAFQTFNRIADSTGAGSRKTKENLLSGLFSRMDELEREYLTRSLFGEMRIGVNEGVLLEAIALAAGQDPEKVRTANMLAGDVGAVAETALLLGAPGLDAIGIRLFVPLKPMLAETAESTKEAIEVLGEASFEYKLDGVRVQIHKDGDEVRIYSRRLTEVTDALPEIVKLVRDRIATRRVILEGEVVAFKDRPLPFQDVMRRVTRVNEIGGAVTDVPLRLYLFDILLKDDLPLTDRPYSERWADLTRTVPEDLVVPRIITGSPAEAESFLERALAEGHEGLMAKRIDSPYIVGRRGKRWLKIKRFHTLDLVIVAADWGYGRRKGWLSDYYLGAKTARGFMVVGKTFKGLTDEEFKAMTTRLLELKTGETRHTVQVRPEVVVEVAFNEVQRSPRYPSRFALRFARIKAVRGDKAPEEADMLDAVERIFEAQFQTKGRHEGDNQEDGTY
jgi:DNA ligase-1